MGMDITGIKPKSKHGKSFRVSGYYWGPIWAYLWEICPDLFNEEQWKRGFLNDFMKVNPKKAGVLSKSLEKAIKSGVAEKFLKKHLEKGGRRDDPFSYGDGSRYHVLGVMTSFHHFLKSSNGFMIA